MKVICLGSGPNMTLINEWDTKDVPIVAVNNVWKGTDKWDYLIHAGDYPDRRVIKKNKSTQEIHTYGTSKSYTHSYASMAEMPYQHAKIFLGLPMYFTCAYWTMHYLKPTSVAFLGFDMNYDPEEDGSTAFYGVGHDIKNRGIPDPFYQFQKEYSDLIDPMKTLMGRLDNIRTKHKVKFYNLSERANSHLPWPKISIKDFMNK